MTNKMTNIFGATAIGLAGAFPTAAQEDAERVLATHEQSFLNCALDAMEKISPVPLYNNPDIEMNVGNLGNGFITVDVTGIPATAPMRGDIILTAMWEWSDAANPPAYFNNQGKVQAGYAHMINSDIYGLAAVDAYDGLQAPTEDWIVKGVHVRGITQAAHIAKIMNEEIISCPATPGVS